MAKVMNQVEILRAACCVAGMDRNVSEKERALLQRLADHAGVGTVSLNAMIERAETDQEFHREQFRVMNTDADATMKVLFCVAIADHELTADELAVLAVFGKRLGLEAGRFEQLRAAAQKQVAAQRKNA